MTKTAAEYQADYRKRLGAMTPAERKRRSLAKQKAETDAKLAEIYTAAERQQIEELQALLAKAQSIASGLNQAVVSRLEAQPLTLDTAGMINGLKDKQIRVSLAAY